MRITVLGVYNPKPYIGVRIALQGEGCRLEPKHRRGQGLGFPKPQKHEGLAFRV